MALLLPPEEAFAPLLTQLLNGFAVVDADSCYVYVSASLLRLVELDKAALLGCAPHAARVRGCAPQRGSRCRDALSRRHMREAAARRHAASALRAPCGAA